MRQGGATLSCLALAREIVEVSPFDYANFERLALSAHGRHPFDAILCLVDIRMIEASRLAEKLGLGFLNVATASLMRDKLKVREKIAQAGIRQPAFALAETCDQLLVSVQSIGYPALVKPSDGYGSQNISIIKSDSDLKAALKKMEELLVRSADYGFGVKASNRFSVEEYISGDLIGCDVFSNEHERVLLGINDKLMFPSPSFAIRGSCFPSDRYQTAEIRDYAFRLLEAVGFNFGAAHIEMIIAENVPYLVEINPRLVSAQIPHQMGYALGRSIYVDLVDLHLGRPFTALRVIQPQRFSAIRWMTAGRSGILADIELPPEADEQICRVVVFKSPGDAVRKPMNNGDRIGYVIAVGKTQAIAESIANQYVRDTVITLQ
jgi:biotin carboxylase